MKDKNRARIKRMKNVKCSHLVRDNVLNEEWNKLMDKETEKLHRKFSNMKNGIEKDALIEKEWEERIIELFQEGKISMNQVSGYVVDKVSSTGKVLETYVISKKEAEKFYDTEPYGDTFKLIRKNLNDVEDEINYVDLYDAVTFNVSFKHRLCNGSIEKVIFSPRALLFNNEREKYLTEEDGTAIYSLLKFTEKLAELYGGTIPSDIKNSLRPHSIKSDFSRNYNIKKTFDIDMSQKMMILDMLMKN